MSEVVNEMQERMLPEYEQLKKFEICSEEQIRECQRKRASFQARITQGERSIRDFGDFIIFEKKVHKWVTEKERAKGMTLASLKASIAARIVRLYREGLKQFPQEERFWANYLMFSRKSAPNEVSGIYEKMLSFHGDKQSLWCDAALWSYEFQANIPRVKDIFFRALQRHPESESINRTFFDILLMEASKMNPERAPGNRLSEQDIALERVEVIYRNSKKKINNVWYFLRLLDRCEEEEFKEITAPLQRIILDDMMMMFPREEPLWDALAQRELRGYNMTDLRQMETDAIVTDSVSNRVFSVDSDSENEEENEPEIEREIEVNPEVKFVEQEKAINGETATEDMDVATEEDVLSKTAAKTTEAANGLAEAAKGSDEAAKGLDDAPKEATGSVGEAHSETAAEAEEEMGSEEGIEIGGSSTYKVWRRRTLNRRIELCSKVYQTAVRVLRTPEMWNMYINAMLKLNQDVSTQPKLKRKRLAIAFKEGHESGQMSVDHYNTFLRMLLESPNGFKMAETVLRQATKRHKSLKLYKIWIGMYIGENKESRVYDTFRRAAKDLRGEGMPIWRLALQYYKLRCGDCSKRLREIYREACLQKYPGFGVFRAEYLEFSIVTTNIDTVRKEYDELCKTPPPSIEMHQKMALIESRVCIKTQSDYDRWRLCFENATHFFGRTHTVAWIDYIKFERDHGDPKRMSVLYQRAMQVLDPPHVDNFISEYSMLTTVI